MTDITRNKWQARGFAIVVFVLFTAGILALNAYRWIAIAPQIVLTRWLRHYN
jgi:hypothetical protein